MMDKLFDFHFHLLFKHLVTNNTNLNVPVRTTGLAHILNDIFGGPFDSQSSPAQVNNSQLHLGVIALLSVEYAFANRVLTIFGIDLSPILPFDKVLFKSIKEGRTTYYAEFTKQIDYHLTNKVLLSHTFNIEYLNRNDWRGKTTAEITAGLAAGNKRYFIFSIEGGHNLSTVPIHQGINSNTPELQLLALQERTDIDFISINLCHLSSIPEQSLGGFAQGVTKLAQVAFHSEDFMPKTEFGLTERGKKVIRQALTHPSKPILIDVKHMSVYTRFHYYRFRDRLVIENPDVAKLPIISSHSGFTFVSLDAYLQNKPFRSTVEDQQTGGHLNVTVETENRRIGRTNDLINKGLFANPWTINLFDEEIVEIMRSKGLIGISMDQRILGASNPAVDSARDRYFEGEYVAYPEWEKLFRDGQLPTAQEGLFPNVTPSSQERHIMLLCLHLVHAVRLGYAGLGWLDDASPWDHLSIGSDFDGLINPIDGFNDITTLGQLGNQLLTYLPIADKYLPFNTDIKALRYDTNGRLDSSFLTEVINKFLYSNGHQFMVRFLSNWS